MAKQHAILSRREILVRASVWLPMMHAGLSSRGLGAGAGAMDRPARIRLKGLRLQTVDVEAQREFYGEAMELPVLDRSLGHVAFAAGSSRLEFVQAREGQSPFYHFAFNIPENKLLAAMEWMHGRAEILTWHKTGEKIVHFERWNADAIYFFDPSGNIVEFIAHHTLDNATAGDFSVADIEEINEIGLVANDVPELVAELDDRLGAKPYLASSPVFTAVGDPRGFFICVEKDRVWLPTEDKAAEIHPVEISLHSESRAHDFILSAVPGVHIEFES